MANIISVVFWLSFKICIFDTDLRDNGIFF